MRYFVRISTVCETGAALKPLLAKELRITGIALDDATVNLEENKAGAKNWDFASKAAAEPAAPAEKSGLCFAA